MSCGISCIKFFCHISITRGSRQKLNLSQNSLQDFSFLPVSSDQYQCTYGQKCKITLKSRKQCKYCRFHKCLEIGMKPTWVMTDEEKKEKREKTIKRKQLPPTLPKDKVQVQLKIILRNIFLSFRSPCTFCFINLMHVSSKN